MTKLCFLGNSLKKSDDVPYFAMRNISIWTMEEVFSLVENEEENQILAK